MTLAETATSWWAATEGLPIPLGPTRIEEQSAYNFAHDSKHAQRTAHLQYEYSA